LTRGERRRGGAPACAQPRSRLALAGRRQGDPVAEVEPYPEGRQPFRLIVNHSFHQAAYDLADATGTGRWDLPYEIAEPNRVLILGAGTGNDTSAALRAGVEHVDAVEIDPVILGLDLDHHPEDPYHHESVDLHVTDARAYLRNSDHPYDLIAFGTLDSHTLFSGLGNVRLDSYVYTAESLVEARDHLTEGGGAVTFSVGGYWIATKLYDIIEHVFGHPPLVFYPDEASSGSDHKVFIAGNDQHALVERSRTLGLPQCRDDLLRRVPSPAHR
jgi:SAM-dependent methyltransferase